MSQGTECGRKWQREFSVCVVVCVWLCVCVCVTQEKKQLVFEGTVGRDVEALARLTEDDLRFLFS